MIDADKNKFITLIYGLGDYYARKMTKGVLILYWEGLKTFSFSEIESAVNLHIADPDAGQFMPKISDINKIINGSKTTRAFLAWSKVADAIKKIGPWESVCFDDAIIHRVIDDMGGWIQLNKLETQKDLDIRMHEFSKRYQGYILQGDTPQHARYLIGITEVSNSAEGHNYDPPRLIGDASKALAIYKSQTQKPKNSFSQPAKHFDEINKLTNQTGI